MIPVDELADLSVKYLQTSTTGVCGGGGKGREYCDEAIYHNVHQSKWRVCIEYIMKGCKTLNFRGIKFGDFLKTDTLA